MSCPSRLVASAVVLLIIVGALQAGPWSPRPFLKDEDVESILDQQIAILSRLREASNVKEWGGFRETQPLCRTRQRRPPLRSNAPCKIPTATSARPPRLP